MGIFGRKPPQPQLPPGQSPVQQQGVPNGMSKGTLESTPCPWCGAKVNLKDVEDYALEPGAVFDCDNGNCKDPATGAKRHFELVRTQPVTVVWLRRYAGTPSFGR